MRYAKFDSDAWPDGVIQLLDDHHLVVLSDSAEARRKFAATLAAHLAGLAETEIITIDGAMAVDLASFCQQMEEQLPIRRNGPQPWWRDVCSVIEALRNPATTPKHRYFIWREAHWMLDRDAELFCRLVNAMFGVAAENEHINHEPLVLQRVVFIGDGQLAAYAADGTGQFSRWLDDDKESPFWEVASVIDRPPVITYRLDG